MIMKSFNRLISPPLYVIILTNLRKRFKFLFLLSLFVLSNIPAMAQIVVENLSGCDWELSFSAAKWPGCTSPVNGLSNGTASAYQTTTFNLPAPYNNAVIWHAVACIAKIGPQQYVEVGENYGPKAYQCFYSQFSMLTDCANTGNVVFIYWINQHSIIITP